MHRSLGIPIVVMNRDVNATSRLIAEEIAARGSDPATHLLVRAEFVTIQGEGPHAGEAAYFIRLGGCNLGSKQEYCQGCDTSFEVSQSKAVLFSELAERVVQTVGQHPARPRVVVVTGGEPLLQAKALCAFLEALVEKTTAQVNESNDELIDWVQFETNGVLLSSALREFDKLSPEAQMMLSFVVSPKASAKGYPNGLMQELVRIADTSDYPVYFKFVVDAEPESNHFTLPTEVLDLAAHSIGTVYVSPFTVYAKPYQGEVSSVWEDGLIDRAQTARNYQRVAELAMAHVGLKVSVQMHTFLGVA